MGITICANCKHIRKPDQVQRGGFRGGIEDGSPEDSICHAFSQTNIVSFVTGERQVKNALCKDHNKGNCEAFESITNGDHPAAES